MHTDYGQETIAVRTGHHRTFENEHSEPIFTTSSFVFRSANDAAQLFAGTAPGNIYSRFTNPTVALFEERLAALEDGERCQATASGMAAVAVVLLTYLEAGDHMVAANNLFGSTIVLLRDYIAKFGITIDFVSLTDTEAFAKAVRKETKLVFIESPSNPLCEIGDIARITDIAHASGALLVVDNCFSTPALQKPLLHGADLIVHSATKYLDGHGRCIGGAVIGKDALIEPIHKLMRSMGATMSPFNAWVIGKSLETLHIRMRAHCENADFVAHALRAHPAVAAVHYLGFADHPQHALAKTQMHGFGGIVSCVVRTGKVGAWRVIDQCRLCSITANLGDAKTTIIHPATTTHGRITQTERDAAGISDGLIRISVGLENKEDIAADIVRGLDALDAES